MVTFARRGVTLLDVVTLATLSLVTAGLLLPIATKHGQELGRQNICRNNLRQLAIATQLYCFNSSNEQLPGYINLLQREDQVGYHDPRTGRTEPVSWVVMVLPHLDRMVLYDQWRKHEAPSAGAKVGAPPVERTHVYIDTLVCPSDAPDRRKGTPISYAANTGIPDYPLDGGLKPREPRDGCLCPTCNTGAREAPTVTPARDFRANGVFFDMFTSSPLFDTTSTSKPVASRLSTILDPKDKTILFAENVDSGDYALSPDPPAPKKEMYAQAEMSLGAIWAPDSMIRNGNPPTLDPVLDSYKINGRTGRGEGKNYFYSRPSSKHGDGVNMAFVAGNVHFVSDRMSYFVYAKLMTSDDGDAATVNAEGKPVLMPDAFRLYQLTDADVSP